MKIKLTERIGSTGQQRVAVVSHIISTADFRQLCMQIAKHSANAHANDGLTYFLHCKDNGMEVPISLCHIPPLYNDLFDALFKNLHIEVEG